jgi:hypothetical protein
MMADIILKDRSGTTVPHGGVTHLTVPNNSGSVDTYTNMKELRCYYAKSETDTNYYTITGQWFCVTGGGYAMGNMTDAQCKELGTADANGNYGLNMIFTTKSLTIGATYHYSDLGV